MSASHELGKAICALLGPTPETLRSVGHGLTTPGRAVRRYHALETHGKTLAGVFDSFRSAAIVHKVPPKTTRSNPSPSTNTPWSGNDASDVDEFIREFRELRKVYHKRMMWGDRWTSGQAPWEDG
ncbi:hypothetical protein M405DRAFT_843989 [Rhizopogon salebrosus TDB-379]|nr:hypothetical protein M405DRAFT_843989 [Rhizopogon salebrosus TDB-379]